MEMWAELMGIIPPPIPMTFKEASLEIDIWEGTGVDDETKSMLHTALDLEVLCDEKLDKWLFYWKRALLFNYPVYKDQAAMWAERKAKEWLFDNYKELTTEHVGAFHLDEATKEEIIEKIGRVIDATVNGKFNGNTDRTINTVDHQDSSGDSENEYTNNTTAKSRAFNFSYPEANYTGGVIPYELDDDPDVEFISNQSDSVSRGNEEHSGSEHYDNAADGTSNTTDRSTTDNTTDTAENRNESINSEKNDDGTRVQDTHETWKEVTNKQGDNINSIVDSLIAQLPMTDFFKQFVDKMLICFKRQYAPWDL